MFYALFLHLGFVHEHANVYTERMSHKEELRDRPHPMQIAIWKKMSPSDRLQCSERLRQTAIAFHQAFLIGKKPDICESELKLRTHEFLQRGTG